MSAEPHFSATIDAQLLYWIRLPAEAGRLDLEQQRYRFERVLPVPVESLHVVATRLRDGGAVLVGIEPERLRSHLAARQDITAATWELLPDRVPEHLALADAPAALRGLNLLQDAFEPDRRRRLRRVGAIATSAGLALVLILALIGIERRAAALEAAADATRRSAQEQLGKALGQSGGRLPNAALLTQELRRLELAARGPAATQLDSAGILQRLWAAWPADIRTQVETVSLVPDRLVVRGSVPTLADAERLAKACPSIAVGEAVFLAAPLQAEQTARGAVFLITWHAQSAGAKGGAR